MEALRRQALDKLQEMHDLNSNDRVKVAEALFKDVYKIDLFLAAPDYN